MRLDYLFNYKPRESSIQKEVLEELIADDNIDSVTKE